MFILITISWCILAARLAEIQVVNGSEYRQKASQQSTGKVSVNAPRGLIFDRHGRQVALNVLKNSLYAYPSDNKEIAGIYRYLDRFYGCKRGFSRKKLALNPFKFKWIDRTLGDEAVSRIQSADIPGLYLKEEMKRVYPFGNAGCQLLGCTDIDGRGISGLEYSLDSVLAGRSGLLDYLRDAHRNTYRIREVPLVKPLSGNSIVLTVDWQFQEIVEEELQAAVDEYNALSGSAVFLDCRTGEILAAADYTSGQNQESIKLKAAADVFEPGSVFKVFTAAALLDENLVDLEEKIYCEEGCWQCGRRKLRDDKKHDSLTFREIFELSSNIGIGKLALRLGGEKLTETARKFGFGTKTFSGLPGEQAGMVAAPGVWSDYNIAALSIGHAISVTPLQLAAAIAAVANDGKLMRPLIIRGIFNPEGKLIKKFDPEFVGKAIKESSLEILREYMIGVVERGTAVPVKSEIITIAGKTGTAEVFDMEKGGYIKNRFNSSFAGFFPAGDPVVAGIVVLHQPRPVTYGGYTAGPAFKKMAERFAITNSLLLRNDSQLVFDDNNFDLCTVPDLEGHELTFAIKKAEKVGFEVVADKPAGTVSWQYPPEGRKIREGEKVAVILNGNDSALTMPDLVGMKIRTAIAVLSYCGMKFEIQGCGIVKKQFPLPGEAMHENTRCRLVCRSA